jgi:hypothetical protein
MIEFAWRTVASATVGGFWVLYVVYVCALVATIFGLEAVLR